MILSKPDRQLLVALSALETDPNFQVVMNWLFSSQEEIYQNTSYIKDEVLVRWNQGAAQAVIEIIEVAMNTRQSLDRLK
jgi:hypothetical protein